MSKVEDVAGTNGEAGDTRPVGLPRNGAKFMPVELLLTRGMPSGMASGTTTIIVLPLPVMLGMGWFVAALLIIMGRVRQNQVLFGWGLIAAGLMTLFSPLSVYGYFAVRDGVFPATPLDLLFLAFLAFLGGTLASIGASYLRVRVPQPRVALGH